MHASRSFFCSLFRCATHYTSFLACPSAPRTLPRLPDSTSLSQTRFPWADPFCTLPELTLYNAGGSNQHGSFTPISQTPSVQASNYRVHRALEPNRTFTRPTPYPFELVRSVRAFRAPHTVEQERGEIMRTGVIQVGTIIL